MHVAERFVHGEQSTGAPWAELCGKLVDRCEYHRAKAERRIRRYKRWGSIFHVSIPLLSLGLTIIATTPMREQNLATSVVATVLTVLTGLNFILEPTRRYREYVQAAVRLHDWRFELDLHLVRGEVRGAAIGMAEYLNQKNSELSEIGLAMAGLPIAREQLG
jgi:hypothetical protein